MAGGGKEASTEAVNLYLQRSEITMKATPTIPTPLRTSKQTREGASELQEQIRRRAYELYEQRGRDDGRDLDDWLQAESDVTAEKAKTVAA
jgi:hypothetical protein